MVLHWTSIPVFFPLPMQLNETRTLAAAPSAVYQALNDPNILQACIPGCESLERVSENAFKARLKLSIGPINTVFDGEVELSDLVPPERYTISGQAKSPVGFARGGAQVTLSEHEGGTRMEYQVDAQISGKLAQLGARLIDATAKKLAAEFFSRLAGQLEEPGAAAAPPAAGADRRRFWQWWIAGGLGLLALGLLGSLME